MVLGQSATTFAVENIYSDPLRLGLEVLARSRTRLHSGDSKGGPVGHGPQIFSWPPVWSPHIFFLISRLSSFGWNIQQITSGQQHFKQLSRYPLACIQYFPNA